MKYMKLLTFLGVLAVASVIPAKANLILSPVSIVSGSTCGTTSAGLTGTLTLLTTGGGNLDFGIPANYGTTEAGCNFRLTGTSLITAANTLTPGTYNLTGSICQLQGASDGCNGLPGGTDPVVVTVNNAGTLLGVSDVAAGGSFSFAVAVATPEPTSLSFVGAGLLLSAFGLLGRKRFSKSS